MLRRDFLGWSADATAILATGCGRRATSGGARKIVVSVRPNLYMAAFFLARERGYFEQAGLDLELQPVDEGHQIAALLAGGKLDVAISALHSALISAVAKGADVRVVAGAQRLTAECADTGRLYGNRRSFPGRFTTVSTLNRELRGKQVAINSLTATNAYYLDVLLDSAGLSERDIKIVPIRYSEAVTAVIKGRLDAFMCNDQFSVQTIADSPELVRGPGMIEILPGFQYRFVSFGKQILRSNPDAGLRFLRAYFKGIADFQKGDTPKFLDQFASSNGMDVARARISCRDNNPPDGEIVEDSITRQVEWYVKKGFCPERVDVSRIIDRSFLERVRKERA